VLKTDSKCSFTTCKLRFFAGFCLALTALKTKINSLLDARDFCLLCVAHRAISVLSLAVRVNRRTLLAMLAATFLSDRCQPLPIPGR
jgi:hypothetical protein